MTTVHDPAPSFVACFALCAFDLFHGFTWDSMLSLYLIYTVSTRVFNLVCFLVQLLRPLDSLCLYSLGTRLRADIVLDLKPFLEHKFGLFGRQFLLQEPAEYDSHGIDGSQFRFLIDVYGPLIKALWMRADDSLKYSLSSFYISKFVF